MPWQFVETFLEFKERQNCRSERINNGHQLVFENGAVWIDSPVSQYGIDPPVDHPGEMAELKRAYLTARLRSLSSERVYVCDQLQNQAHIFSSGCGANPDHLWPNWREHIKSLNEQIETLKAELTAVTVQCNNKRSTVYSKMHQLTRDLERQQADAISREVVEIANVQPKKPRGATTRRNTTSNM